MQQPTKMGGAAPDLGNISMLAELMPTCDYELMQTMQVHATAQVIVCLDIIMGPDCW